MYKFELIIINSVYSTQCRVVNIQSERLIETSLSDGVNCTHSSCVANVLYKYVLIIINSVYSTQCRIVNIPSERLIETSLSDGVNCTHSSCVANLLYKFELIIISSVYSTQCRGSKRTIRTTDQNDWSRIQGSSVCLNHSPGKKTLWRSVKKHCATTATWATVVGMVVLNERGTWSHTTKKINFRKVSHILGNSVCATPLWRSVAIQSSQKERNSNGLFFPPFPLG